jgi:hypothetical protein
MRRKHDYKASRSTLRAKTPLAEPFKITSADCLREFDAFCTSIMGTDTILTVGLWVVVDHHSLLSELVEGQGSVDSAPVKLHGTTNAINTAAKY